jgi:hypothetical protein
MFHHEAKVLACAEVFVQDQPYIDWQADFVRQSGHQLRVAAGDPVLDKSNA